MDNIERNNQSRHSLFSVRFGEKSIQEPQGWADDTRNFKRDKQSRGIMSKISIELEFFGDGAEYLSTVYNSYGISERVYVIKEEKNEFSLNEKWGVRYIQEIDMASYIIDEKTGGVKVKATQGGLYDEVKKGQGKKVDLINKLSIDEVNIGNIKTYPFQPQPRSIYLKSLLEDSQNGYRLNSERYRKSRSESHRTVPLKVIYNPNSNVSAPANSFQSYNDLIPHEQGGQIGSYQAPGNQIIWRSDVTRRVNLKLALDFTVVNVSEKRTGVFGDPEYFYVQIRVSELDVDGNDDILVSKTNLLSIGHPDTILGVEQNITYDGVIDLEKDQSLSVVFESSARLGDNISSGYMDVFMDISKSEAVIEDSTDYPTTTSRAIKPFDLFERIIAKITGKTGLFKSNIFGNGGEYEHMIVDNGFWARGFPDVVLEDDGEEREIQFNTSFKEAFDAFNYLEPLAWFVEIEGKKEVVRIESAKYTMKNFIGVELPPVDDVSSKASKADYFSSIKIGTKKTLEFEELNGLDEPNGLTELNTHIKEETLYDASINYRVDPVGYELTRRKSYVIAPKEDTPRDSHIWIHDAKILGGKYYHNLWGDRFDSAPTGVFSPETAWNLWLSPMNRFVYGHGYSVKRGLFHFPDKKISFGSSNANKNLKTTYNSKELSEGSSIFVSELERARVEATKVEISFKMTREVEDQILGQTQVDGELVSNYFGLFKYEYNGETRYGRLISLKTDEEGKLILQKARL